MATRHGLAGQYGKSQAGKRFQRIFDLSLYAMGLIGGILGWLLGHFGVKNLALPAFLTMVGVAVGIYLVVRYAMGPLVDGLAKDRIKHLRGAQAEGFVAWLLEGLDDDWHIFNTVKLVKDSDIDHILVGPSGLYCISTKSQRGQFTGTGDGLLHNGNPCAFAQQALHQTMYLKDRLQAMMGEGVPWIQSVLAVPFGFTNDDACGGKVMLVHMENIMGRIAPEGAKRKLDKHQIERLAKVLEMLRTGAAGIYERPT